MQSESAWWGTRLGQAVAAFNAGDEFFQFEAPYASLKGHANAAWTGTSRSRRSHGPATDALGQVEAAGWHLEHASWVYVQTGQNSRDKFLASGQQVVVTGEVIGIYLFRRSTEQPEITGPPGVPTAQSLAVGNDGSMPPLRWSND